MFLKRRNGYSNDGRILQTQSQAVTNSSRNAKLALFLPHWYSNFGQQRPSPEILALVFQHEGNSLHALVTPRPACGPYLVPGVINSVMRSTVKPPLGCVLCTQPLPKDRKVSSFLAAA